MNEYNIEASTFILRKSRHLPVKCFSEVKNNKRKENETKPQKQPDTGTGAHLMGLLLREQSQWAGISEQTLTEN